MTASAAKPKDAPPRARPFIKAVGGKRQLLPELRKHVPADFHKREATYYEPFVGGGSLFFDMLPTKAVLGEMNEPFVRTYLAIRDDVQAVMDYVDDMIVDTEEFETQRRRDPKLMVSHAECAAWVLYLNHTCYNGLWRVNKRGIFNSPWGKYQSPTLYDEANLFAASKALQAASIRHADFAKTVTSAEKGDFVYCDPPYVPKSVTSDFTSYTAEGFGWDDQCRLRDVAWKLKKRGVHVLLSNADVPVVRELYKDFALRPVSARRSINNVGTGRGPVGELLIW